MILLVTLFANNGNVLTIPALRSRFVRYVVLDSSVRWNGRLFYSAFLVDDMFANHWIVFFDFHFLRLGALVFGGGVKVAATSTGYQFDFLSHDDDPSFVVVLRLLDGLFAASADIA